MANLIDINSKTEFLNNDGFCRVVRNVCFYHKKLQSKQRKKRENRGKEDNIKVDGRRKEIFLLASHTEERAEAFGY